MATEIANVTPPADKDSKVELFRSLFRGREDVYAERFRMKDGKWGYPPAGKKDWAAVLASKPEDYKKVDRQTRILYPLNADVVRLHLTGKKTVGIYPLLSDETCWLLAADFDKKTWQEDALAFVATCHKMGVPAYQALTVTEIKNSHPGKNASHASQAPESPTPGRLRKPGGAYCKNAPPDAPPILIALCNPKKQRDLQHHE